MWWHVESVKSLQGNVVDEILQNGSILTLMSFKFNEKAKICPE
jgi:hypothetical protein